MSDPLREQVAAVPWYHTIDLGGGVETPGHYDHRPYLHHYGIPARLDGKRVLDVGAASGFFSFELERRGGEVTATDLPAWFDHDFGPTYRPDQSAESGQRYLHQPFEIARRALGSRVTRREINIYDLSPETVGRYDLLFCGSVLLHLTDPIRALWRLASVTKERAILATAIQPADSDLPIAHFIGHRSADVWWIPTRRALELMIVAAGFVGVEWVSDFQLNYRDGSPGPYHGVVHAYPTTAHWGPETRHRDELLAADRPAPVGGAGDGDLGAMDEAALRAEARRLRALVQGYERGRFIRLTRWLGRMMERGG